jgi:hypothetical protein
MQKDGLRKVLTNMENWMIKIGGRDGVNNMMVAVLFLNGVSIFL